MKNRLKINIAAVLSLMAFVGTANPMYAVDAADQPLIMTIRTDIFNYQGPENFFTIYLGTTPDTKEEEYYVEGPKSAEYIYVEPYSIESGNEGTIIHSTAIPLSVSENDNEVRIYGDASKIDFIDVHGCYLNEIILSDDFTNLSVIDLSHNYLTSIDLTPYSGLNSIDLTDNAFTDPTKMIIGANHPNLVILYVGINDVLDPDFNLSNYPEMIYFNARNNYGLTWIDPSGCPNLQTLMLEVTNIETIDVSKNEMLRNLDVSNTKITSVDVSRNVYLTSLNLSHEGSYNTQYKVTSVDVSKNQYLQTLSISNNNLTDIDVSHNPNLRGLQVQKNFLTHIDLSNNPNISSLNLSNNLFTFATLPIPKPEWDYYYYRSPLACNFKYKVNEPIDFSADVIRAPYQDETGNTITPETFAMAFGEPRVGEKYELDEKIYTYKDGVITFHEAVPDSVYIEFYCTAFPDWPMQTQLFAVKTEDDFDAPSPVLTITPASQMTGSEISFKLAAIPVAGNVKYPADITIKYGDESLTLTGAITSPEIPDNDNIAFRLPATTIPVEVLIADGFSASALVMDNIWMSSIDLTPSSDITILSITNAGLTTIDLGFNRSLRTLDLSNNSLREINLSGVRGDYEKYYLNDVNLANNRLRSFSATIYDVITKLNLADNEFTDFDFKYFTGLKNLNLSGNALSGTLDLSKIERMTDLNIAGNAVNSIIIGSWDSMRNLDVTNNNLTFATLPILKNEGLVYRYSPQNKFAILSAGASIDLSDLYIDVNGNTTDFVWKYADNGETVPTDLYNFSNGSTIFGTELIGKMLYCEMTNQAFPDFNDSPLTTTNIKVLDKPTNVVAKFTPTKSGEVHIGFRFNKPGANAVYIDWKGDGSQYDEYLYDEYNSEIYRTGMAAEGKTAVVYTYNDPADVSMLFTLDIPLADFDATPMTKAEAFDIHNAGLTDGNIRLPQSESLYELVLDGSKFTEQTFTGYPVLRFLNLANNDYSHFDLSQYPNVTFASLSDNHIENITFGNNKSLYQLDLTNNRLNDIDLSGLTGLKELLIADNLLHEIDLSPVQNHLQSLNIAGNYFTFATLPKMADFNLSIFTTYYYANQKPITVQCVNGKVDLSDQAIIDDTETVYRWFLGDKQSDVYYDYYYEMFVGEELEGPEVSDDPEYSVENGITTFYYNQKRRVICAMTNEAYPNLILYTTPTAIEKTGVEDVAVGSGNTLVDVYTISGVCVRRQVVREEATDGLVPGLYIVNGEKILIH